jgi:hypothetical protein
MAEQIVKFYSYNLFISDKATPYIKTLELYGDFNHVVEDDEGPMIDLYTTYEDGRRAYVIYAFKLNDLGRIVEQSDSLISMVTTSPNELDAWNSYLAYLDEEAFKLNSRALLFRHAHEVVDKAMKVLAQEDDENGLN